MDPVSELEMEVARILRNLPKLIRISQSRRRVSCCNAVWGVKKRRSAFTRRFQSQQRRILSSLRYPLVPPKDKKKIKTPSVLSPTSPLCFYQKNGWEETATKLNVTATSSRSSKKAKIHKNEWIKEQKSSISDLYEVNRNLQQEAAVTRIRYESLLAENTRMKEMKSKLDMTYQKSKMSQQQGGGGGGGGVGHHHRHRLLLLLPNDRVENPTTGTVQVVEPPIVVAPQFWTLSPLNANVIPDLNACIDDECGSVATDQPQNDLHHHQQQQQHPLEKEAAKKIAAAEARKRRVEINRRKL